ncbi:MAG TPA: hypothetical protein DEP07_11005 [Brevibacillus sp.]|nr:hypothetical protein [Brevibacillus sp.]
MQKLKRAAEAFLLWLLLRMGGGEQNMAIATIYVTLIIEGNKTFAQVPNQQKLRAEVKSQLEVLGFLELAQ